MIILAQTDTTAGFLAASEAEINAAKGRAAGQKCIKTFGSCAAAKGYARLSGAAKNLARKASRATLVVGAKSLRICRGEHGEFLRELEKRGINGLFSSSANAHGAGFCCDFALARANVLAVRADVLNAHRGGADRGGEKCRRRGGQNGGFVLLDAKSALARKIAGEILRESAPSAIYKFRGRRKIKLR